MHPGQTTAGLRERWVPVLRYLLQFPPIPYLVPRTYPVVSVDRWDTTDVLATSSLHSSRLSAFLVAAPNVKPVHSGMLSSHLFFCLPRLLPPWTVPCLIVLSSPDDLVMWPYHLSLSCLTGVRRSSWGPMACRVLFRTSSLVMWSLYLYNTANKDIAKLQRVHNCLARAVTRSPRFFRSVPLWWSQIRLSPGFD